MNTHRHVGTALLGLVLAVLSAIPAQASSATTPAVPAGHAPASRLPQVNAQTRAAELVEPATVFVRVDTAATIRIPDADFEYSYHSQGGCTGFVVNPDGYIVTAGHCLNDGLGTLEEGIRDDLPAFFDNEYAAGSLDSATHDALEQLLTYPNLNLRVEGDRPGSEPRVSVHVAVGGVPANWSDSSDKSEIGARVLDVVPFDHGDVTLLKINQHNLPVVSLAEESSIQIGQQVMTVAYPLAQADLSSGDPIGLTNRMGVINSINTEGQYGPGDQFYETSIDATQGTSGAAVVDLQGHVIGLVSHTVKGEASSFAVPASVIADVLAGRAAPGPGRIDTLYRQGLENYYRGYFTDAIADFDQVLAIMPGLPVAAEKRSDAADRRQRFGDEPKSAASGGGGGEKPALVLVAGGGVVALVLILGTAAVVTRRRRRQAKVRVIQPVMPAVDSGPMPGPVMNSFGDLVPAAGTVSTDPMSTDPVPGEQVPDPAPLVDLDPMLDPPSAVDPWPVRGPAPAVDPAPARNYCAQCGTSAAPDGRFCTACGSALGSTTLANARNV